jgi:hypothetical protein
MKALVPLFVLVIVFVPVSCRSIEKKLSVITVGSENCDFASLQTAVDQFTPDYDLILLMDRQWIESGITINKSVVISGKAMNRTILSGSERSGEAEDRIFLVKPGGSLTLKDLSVTNGRPGGMHRYGGAIANSGNVVLRNARIAGNQAVYGAGLWNEGTMEVIDSVIEKNTGLPMTTEEALDASGCTGSGGGIKNEPGGTLIMRNTLVRENSATRRGGGAFLSCESESLIINCRFEENFAIKKGGALHLRGDLTMEDCVIKNNSSNSTVGGFLNKGNLVFRNNTIINNDGADFAMGDSLSGIYGRGVVSIDENNNIEEDRRK